MSLIYIERATLAALPDIMAIIDSAKALLKADGSPQWQDGYPDTDTLKRDIAAQQCWLLMVDGKIAGTATMVVADDPNYHQIYNGAWQNTTDPYATIHRIAIGAGFGGQHLSHYFFSNLISAAYRDGIRNFRIDTHDLNKRMQAIVTSFGYAFRGKIYVDEPAENPEDNARRAYELNL
ncbi:GNAT family N-acetyltransferase [Levilactobacillus namurensis]|uniref:GNAT family N-acetyltransferase n=1 Tax=Levilactobacillus namurensis TaxID=380393 RepID=UPI00222E2EB6|nr:GNAT family N-acetyltransferase [Levilactobacillus namurensis]MCW3779225.1 GNAT family N-acetyltransferase [Levilactobacillus namurensis]MDT7019968.1 GNAT family N-acetyltransferase [Levilactobacillus namurensis]WNN65455.1 GNAT family N-acetyltransferase [Levilactobacillus namurensis]